MKKLLTVSILSCLFLFGCKSEKKETAEAASKELSVLEKLAQAHGYGDWKNIEEIKFTFNVDRDSSHFERSWTWKLGTNEVIGVSQGDTAHYKRQSIDSSNTRADAAFINDKYWLLAPFNLVWDSTNFAYQHTASTPAPISKKPMQKLTIVYGNEGGYTPGDAYDFYFEEDMMIKEWVFRKANAEAPSMITSWEDYEEKGGLLISKMHKKPDEDFKLYFTNVEVVRKQ